MSKATYRLRIENDPDPQSPGEWDCGVFLITTRNRYFHPEEPKGWSLERCRVLAGGKPEEGDDPPSDEEKARYKVFPLYAYIHSGVALSLGRHGQFSDRWDSGMIGFVVVDVEETGTPDPEKLAEGSVEEWNQYLSGDVWGYVVERVETCSLGHEHVTEQADSCWGIYGEDYCREEGERALASYVKDSEQPDNGPARCSDPDCEDLHSAG